MTDTWATELKEKRCVRPMVSVDGHWSHGVRQGITGEWGDGRNCSLHGREEAERGRKRRNARKNHYAKSAKVNLPTL